MQQPLLQQSAASAIQAPPSPLLTSVNQAVSTERRPSLISSGRSPRVSYVGSSAMHGIDFGASPGASPAWHPVASPQVILPSALIGRSPNYQYAAAPRDLVAQA